MLIIVTYDVNTESSSGRKRLRHIAKICEKYGQRVQNSVFECSVDSAQLPMLKAELIKIMDNKLDSLRFYNLGNKYKTKIEHFGTKDTYDLEDTLIV